MNWSIQFRFYLIPGGVVILGRMIPPRQVVSASRRSDVPAFHAEWLMGRLRAGWCEVRNPFGGQVRRVDLRPDAVLALVLWTRDPTPLLPHLPELVERGYRALFQITCNAYPTLLEPGAVPTSRVVAAAARVVEVMGEASVVWRYDPVILTDLTPPAYHLDRVGALAGRLQGLTDTCITSFVDLYRKTLRNLEPVLAEAGVGLLPPDAVRDKALIRDLAATVSGHGMGLELCCEPEHVGDHAGRARCVDDRRLSRLLGEPVALRAAPSRKGCGCRASVDIGAYDTCARGCVYCYANHSPEAGRTGRAAVDPGAPSMHRR